MYGFLLVFYSNFVPTTHHFWDIRLQKSWPWNPGYGSLKVIVTDTDRFVAYDFLLRSIVTMGLSRTVSVIYGDFSQKRKIFPPPSILRPRWRGSHWNWVPALSVKKLKNDGATWSTNKFDDIFSRLDTIHQRDERTDIRTDVRTDGHRATAKTAVTHSVAR